MSLSVPKALLALLLPLISGIALGAPPETKALKDARMKWWKDARFGLFLHWGTYSVPAGEWNGKTNYAEWIREEAHIPLDQYVKFAQEFNPVKFDADKWVSMAKNAGMRYIVITTKHHEGFNMFASKYTDYNIMNTPFHRDVMKELSEAVRKQGLHMGWYHSIMDWDHPDYLPRRSWEDRPVDGADYKRFVQYLRNDVTQLLTDYGPIGVMWFDGEWESTWNHEYGQALYDLCRQLQPNVIVNNRVDVGRSGVAGMSTQNGTAGDYGTPEQEIPPQGLPGTYWETCMTMNDHWGYNKNDHDYKTTEDLVRKLVDICSKGGNFLLNIGPTAEGEFPPEAIDRLQGIGKWMKVNNRAIYDTDASPFPTNLAWGRCTQGTANHHPVLYLDVFDWPTNGELVVPGIGNTPIKAYALADTGKELGVERREGDLVIKVPSAAPDPICSVVALEIQGSPVIYRTPEISASTDQIVQPVTVTMSAGAGSLAIHYTLDGSEPTASSPLYSGPIDVSSDTVVTAKTFDHGKAVSSASVRKFTVVKPLPAASVANLQPDLAYKVYAGNWDNVPDFSSLTPESNGTFGSIGVDKWPLREYFGLDISGYLNVPSDGVYNFELSSDDGSKLVIDGQTVVDNDGLHSMTAKTGSIALAKGLHAIRIGYFNKTGGLGLQLQWGLAGQALKPVDEPSMSH